MQDSTGRHHPLVLALALGALLVAMPVRDAGATTESVARPPRAIGYAMYDKDLLFLAAKVDDINLTGTNVNAMSEPWRDDAVDFYLDLSGESADAVNPGCARVVVSAAGGFSVLVGTTAGVWRAQPEWLMGIKIGVEREGTLNRPDDTDTGYTVEVGIPWRFLGAAPRPDARIGFNFVVHVRGENETFISWSSAVHSQTDLDQPGLWGKMVFTGAMQPGVAQNDVIMCPVTVSTPVVDGRVSANEWVTASVMQLEKPAPEVVWLPPAAVAGKPGGRLLATYRYDYQPQPSPRAAEAAAPALANQPPHGFGPWFSTDSIAWHAAMLHQARAAAIDTILPIYSGDAGARARWSRLGLLRLVQALKQAKDGRLSYPLVGMYLDAASSFSAAGGADLTAAEGKQALWDMIAEFYRIVPEEFRAQFDVNRGDPANLLVLGPPLGVQNWDGTCFDYCREMYRRTFGARLLILGDQGWYAHAPNLDGYCALEPGVGLSQSIQGRPTARISPGYVSAGRILPRHGGDDYEQNWTSIISQSPDFVIVDSLNDFAAGSEIGDSRQFGVRFLDITRQSALALAGRREYQIALLRETLPPSLNPDATYRIELLIENQGFQDLTQRENVEVGYTLQSKQRAEVRRSGIAVPVLLVRAGQRAPIVIEIPTKTTEGPLPGGDYELKLEVTKSPVSFLRSAWLLKHLFQVSLPVRIQRGPAYQATVLSTTLPTAMAAGARRRVRVRLRNDGASAWRAGDCALSYHWLRAPGLAGATAKPEVIEFEGVRAPLPKDVAPGEMVTTSVWVEARKADGTPLPAWTPDQDWLYCLQWDVVQGKDRWFSRAGGAVYEEMVAVLSTGWGATVVNSELPERMEAGRKYAVRVLVRNDGPAGWDAARCRLAYHWYYWDGAVASWQNVLAPLSAAVAPGEAALVTAEVTAPDYAGSYRLAWDFVCDESYASEALDSASRDMLVQPVSVAGGIYEPLDLSKLGNVFAATQEGFATRGGFDAVGSSFPAEFIPPDAGDAAGRASSALYPGVYYGGARSGDSPARIPLRWLPKDQRGAPAVTCVGQETPLPQQPVRAIYIAAAATDSTAGEFRVTYSDGTSEATTLLVPSWTDESPAATVVLTTPYLRTTQNDSPTPAHIYLLRIGDLPRRGPAAALILPKAPQIKVFAITVELQPAAATGGS